MVAAVTVRKNGKAEMAYVGAIPWHGLGQELKPGESIETWKQAAGMDWEIERSQIHYVTKDGTKRQVQGSTVLYRSDSHEDLGLVSEKYQVVQPGETLEFFRDLADDNGFTLETAGTLFGGKRFWALAAIGEEAVIIGKDSIRGYLLLATSADGTLATTGQFTATRVVCNNTLGMALRGESAGKIKIRHSTEFNHRLVKAELGIAKDTFGKFLKVSRALAKKSLSNDKAGEFVSSLLVDTKTIYTDDPRESRQYQKIMDLFRDNGLGATLKGSAGTAWGVVNAVTEFVDHHAKASTDSHRLASAWFGRGDALKSEALERAIAL